MIRYTKTVRGILDFIDEFGFITSPIAGNMFYKGNKFAVQQARNRLRSLVENGDIIAKKQPPISEFIYQFKNTTISDHKYYLLNLYSQINLLVDKIEYFKLEETWSEAHRRSDAHIVYSNTINGEKFLGSLLIEFDKFHKTDLNKYIEIYETGEVQRWYANKFNTDLDYFPNVLVINHNEKVNIEKNDNFDVFAVNYNFEGLPKII